MDECLKRPDDIAIRKSAFGRTNLFHDQGRLASRDPRQHFRGDAHRKRERLSHA